MGAGYPAAWVWRVCQLRTLPKIHFAGRWMGKSSGGGVGSGKPLKPLLGLPCAAGEGGVLPVSPEPFPCQALLSLGLLGAGGFAPALPFHGLSALAPSYRFAT